MLAIIIQAVRTFTEELVTRFRPMIVRLAASITHDEFQAEDIAQEVLLILNRKQDVLRDLSSDKARNYIYTVTRNYAVKSAQKKSKEDVTFCDPVDLNSIEGEPDIRAFTDEYGFSDETASLLEALSLEDRTLIAYRYGDGYSFREIEKLTGIPAETLRKRMQRCKAKLREHFRREARHD